MTKKQKVLRDWELDANPLASKPRAHLWTRERISVSRLYVEADSFWVLAGDIAFCLIPWAIDEVSVTFLFVEPGQSTVTRLYPDRGDATQAEFRRYTKTFNKKDFGQALALIDDIWTEAAQINDLSGLLDIDLEEEDETGFDNYDHWAVCFRHALDAVLARDPTRGRRLGEAAAAACPSWFDAPKATPALKNLYDTLVERIVLKPLSKRSKGRAK